MENVTFTVISIGALSHNRLWGEACAVRTAHATTTLVETGDRLILVDPSLPAAAMAARFNERTGKILADVTDVFCTTLRPVHRRSLQTMPEADWWCSETELEAFGEQLAVLRDSADRLEQEETALLEADMELLEKFKPAPDRFSEQVHLYPLAGPSVGGCGLLLTPPTQTIAIAGDAALTRGHVLGGQVWEGCADAEAAMESLRDVLEIADVIVPGHDNVMPAPRQWM